MKLLAVLVLCCLLAIGEGKAVTKIIKLNVGGTRYEASSGLLSVHGSLLAELIKQQADGEEGLKDSDGAIFVDREGAPFQDILSFLRRDQQLPSQLGSEPETLLQEATYYRLPSLVSQLQKRFPTLQGSSAQSRNFSAEELYQMTIAAASKQEEAFLQEYEEKLSAFLQRQVGGGLLAATVYIPATMEQHQLKQQQQNQQQQQNRNQQQQQNRNRAHQGGQIHGQQQVQFGVMAHVPATAVGGRLNFLSEPFAGLTPLLCDRAVAWVVERGFRIDSNSITCPIGGGTSSYCQHCAFTFYWARHLAFTSF